MPTLLTLHHGARLLGVSPGRLYRAIDGGRLTASPGGGPGKPTLISLEALQAFAQREGLHVPEAIEIAERPARLARSEPAERSTDDAQARESLAGQVLAQVMTQQGNYVEAFLRDELGHLVVRVLERTVEPLAARVTERLTRAERPEHAERLARPEASADMDLLALLQALLPQPRYLRDLGVETFPLARLNARLAPLGYVIEAKKVRDPARFVACTDVHGQVEAFGLFTLRAVAMERLEPAERLARDERSEHSERAERPGRAAVLARLRTMHGEGLSLQAMANRLNNEGAPTLSGKGTWRKGTVGKLLAQEG